MKFAKLRLHGFKSFVESTELTIAPGLTGVVGPNGCGKSNLVEALRWVMGETSAKRMRGGEMEDVIFGGTSNRPARNMAEVVLGLENDEKTVPPPFNEADELDVARKIERGNGSDYRINGKAVRARDVQILFADHGTGATSTAMVSQGKVGAVINAKPTQRRSILEEAAGISGLHARRHEAELRLRAAENNLERVEDVLGTMETQLGNLKRQARQAARYRTISDRIRQADALLLHKKWIDAQADLEQAQAIFAAAEIRVRELLVTVAQESTAQTNQATAMPPLREAAAQASAKVQRLKLEAEQLATEAKRLESQQNAAANRLAQIEQDQTRASTLLTDAADALARLQKEKREIETAQEGENERETEAITAAGEAQSDVARLDERVASLTRETAVQETAQRNLTQRLSDLARRLENVASEKTRLESQLTAMQGDTVAGDKLSQLEAVVTTAEAKLAQSEKAQTDAEATISQADQAHGEARQAEQTAQSALNKIQAEISALQHLIGKDTSGDSATGKPVLDDIKADTGFETALAAALGLALDASTDADTDYFWRADGAPVPTPKTGTALVDKIKAPANLTAALQGIAVVIDREAGDKAAGDLQPGQLLVTKEGELWRWDGYTARKPAATDAAAKLEQRNRLTALTGELATAEQALSTEQTKAATAREALATAREAEQSARQAVRAAYAAVGEARSQLTQTTQAQSKAEAAMAGLRERIAGHARDLTTAQEQQQAAKAELQAMPSLDEAIQVLDDFREQLTAARATAHDKQQLAERIKREIFGRKRRVEAIDQEVKTWNDRMSGADEHSKDLATRAAELRQELTDLQSKPDELAAKEQHLSSSLSEAERESRAKSDLLQEAEENLSQIDRRLRQAEGHSADSREARARAEAAVDMARNKVEQLKEESAERLECRPEQALSLSEHGDKPVPPLEDLQRRVERLRKERETLGAVNLRAEEEADALQGEIDTLVAERDDLIAAINRLRQGIAKLKSEARQRLLDAFAKVDQAFQHLFVTLFGGGRAQLTLTEAEDPLDAGLEIYASPPGKRLQNLSLLSGGEQALTAIALLFAIFQTNPSPICVLDEVDAPLDEANVDRFCNMLDEMVKTDTTRFLVITHHRLTMARMHRLYGVTMAERGVSQLVAVDLDEGAKLREAG
ncbi:MAG: chromosome segregation protein SMC [Pseudomonadota bacterium]